MRIRSFTAAGVWVLFGISVLAPMAIGRATPADSQNEVPSPSFSTSKRTGYDRVLIDSLNLRYTKEIRPRLNRNGRKLEGKDLERIKRYYREAVTGKLGEAFPIASKPGPGVLRIHTVLFDHVVDKREWLAPTRFRFSTLPRIQLVALLRDSQTGEIIDQIGLTLRPHANRLMPESPSSYRYFMRRVFDSIAARVRWSLDEGARSASSLRSRSSRAPTSPITMTRQIGTDTRESRLGRGRLSAGAIGRLPSSPTLAAQEQLE